MTLNDISRKMAADEGRKHLEDSGCADLIALQKPQKGMTHAELSQLISQASAVAAACACDDMDHIVAGLVGYLMHEEFNADSKDVRHVLEAYTSQVAAAMAFNIARTLDVPLANVLGAIQGNISTISLQLMEKQNASKARES